MMTSTQSMTKVVHLKGRKEERKMK